MKKRAWFEEFSPKVLLVYRQMTFLDLNRKIPIAVSWLVENTKYLDK